MSTLQYQNPVTVDAVLDSVSLGGSPELRREILVLGDSTGANVTLVTGRIPVDGSGVTQPVSGTVAISGTVPVSGTFFQATQPVSIAASVAVTGTFFQATQPVSIAAAVDVSDRTARLLGSVRMQDGSGTALTSTGSALDINLKTSSITLPVTLASTSITGTVAVTQSTSPWVDNISQFGGNNVVTGTGVSGVGIPRVTVSSDSFPATQAVNLSQVGGAGVTLGAKTSANSIPVVLASDEATLPVSIAATVNVSVQNSTLAVTQSTSPWVVQDTAAEASLVQIQQELRQQSAFPNLSQVAAFQSSASATTLTLTFVSGSTLGAQLLLAAMSSTTTKPTFAQTGGTGTVVRGTDLKNSTTSPSVQIDMWRVTVAGTIIMTATFASGACAAIGYEISGLPLYGSLPNSQPFYDSLQISQGTASAATLNSFFTLLPGELPFLFVGLGSASTVSSSNTGTTRLTNFALDGTNVSQNVAASGNLQTFYAGRISGGPLEDMTNMTPAATFSGSSLFTCIYVSFKPVSMPIGGTVGSVLTQIAGNVVISAAPGVQQVGIVGGTGISLETTAGVLDLNLKNIGNSPVVTGTGLSGVGVPRVTVSSDSFPTGTATDANLISGNDTQSQIMLILESTRRAIVALACEGGRNSPVDFDPNTIAREEGADDYAD